jgi:hypothetical protein
MEHENFTENSDDQRISAPKSAPKMNILIACEFSGRVRDAMADQWG